MYGTASRTLDEALQLEWIGDWALASEHYRELRASDDPNVRCMALIRLARCLLETCKPREADEAEDLLVEARKLTLDLDDAELRGQLLLQRGRLAEQQGDLKRARDRYSESRDCLKIEGADLTEVDFALASAERRRGELNAALARLEAIAPESLPTRLRADFYDELGAVRLARGEAREAIEALEEGLELDQATASSYASARSRLLLAEAYMRTGLRDDAKALIIEAIDVYETARADAGLSEAHALMGLWHEDREDYASAAQCYQDSYERDRASDDRAGQARAKRHLARTFCKRGDTDRARELLNDAHRLLPDGDDVEAAALFQEEGNFFLAGSDPAYDKAISAFSKALSIAREDGDERVIAIAQRNLARALREDDQLEAAHALLVDAREALEQRGDLRELDDLLDDLGEVLLEQDRYDEAKAFLLESLDLDHRLGRIASRGRTLVLLGQVAARMGDPSEAGAHFRAAVSLYEGAHHSVGLSDALLHLGSWHLQERQLERAKDALRKGLRIDHRLDDPLGCARAKRLLAAASREQGDLLRAREYLGEAERDLRRIDDPVEHAHLDVETGRLEIAEGLYRQARERLESAQNVFQQAGSPVDEATCKRFSAVAAAYEGSYGEAINLLEAARLVFEQRQDLPELDELYDDLGMVYLMTGEVDLAAAAVQDSLEVDSRSGSRTGKGRSFLMLARIAKHRGDFTEAKRKIDDARAIFSELDDEVGQAEAYLELGDWHTDSRSPHYDLSTAVAAYKDARRLEQRHRDPRGIARCSRKLAHVYIERGEFERAGEALEDAVSSLKGVDDQRELAPVNFELGRLAAAQGHPEDAIAPFRAALEGYNRLSQEDDRRLTYQLLVTAYQMLGRTDDALECMRELGAERTSMYNALLKDLHPWIAEGAQAAFESGQYAQAIVGAFARIEHELKRRVPSNGKPPGNIHQLFEAWQQGAPDSLPRFGAPRGNPLGAFCEFCVDGFTLLRNPAQHDPPRDLSAGETFAALCVAHWIASVLDGTATLGIAATAQLA